LVAAVGECNAQTGTGDAYLPFREVLTALTTGAEGSGPSGGPSSPKHASRLKDFVRVASETLLLVGPDLVGLFVPGAAVATKVVTTAAFRGNLADKLAAHVG
jgi:adenylate cyclase